jgi:PDZ domain-containing protein
MTSATTATESVPGETRVPGPPVPRVLWWPVVTIVAIVGSLVGANNVKIPYYAIAPGDAVAVAPLVHVTGGPSYAPTKSVYLCTVSIGQTTVFEALRGWLDPTVDVVPEKVVLPPHVDSSKFIELNLKEMDISKEKAIGVAFEQLGYHAIKGGGAVVTQVIAGLPAAAASIGPGDVITAVDAKPVEFRSDAIRILGTHKPGDAVDVRVNPKGGGAPRQVRVVLGSNPQQKGRAFLGVSLDDATPHFDFPYKVDISSERIGGPSAGLAFTLQVLDVLTKGELTGGQKVAVTGTIELDGSVGEIGGVVQKTEAVKAAGVHIFLVPTSEVAQARRHAGKGLRVEGVRNVHDALRILAGLGGNGLTLGQPGRHGA